MQPSVSTGQTDKNGVIIRLGDTVKVHSGADSFIGIVVFANCAFRILTTVSWNGDLVNDSAMLMFNYSLLFSEINGTKRIEVIK